MLIDIDRYGYYQNGIYKGYKWSMSRHEQKFWCGYIECGNITEYLYDEVERYAHFWDITIYYKGEIRFD